MKETTAIIGVVGLIALVVAAILLVPFAFIWALNTLFMLTIPYSLKTWGAALIISLIVHGTTK